MRVVGTTSAGRAMDDDGKNGERSGDGLGGGPVFGDRVRFGSRNAYEDEICADAGARGGGSYSRCTCRTSPGSECHVKSGEERTSDIEQRAARGNLREGLTVDSDT